MQQKHSILGGKVHLYRRPDSGDNWFCSTYLKGKNRRHSTKETSLPLAREIAEDWYLELRGKARAGIPLEREPSPAAIARRRRRSAVKDNHPDGVSFNDAADKFLEEYGVINAGQVSERWIEGHKNRLEVHLKPFFGPLTLPEITPGKIQEYRQLRMTQPKKSIRRAPEEGEAGKKFKPPARNTINSELTTLRHVLKTGKRHGWLDALPDLSPPYKAKTKIEARPWFTPEEYKTLYLAARDNARTAKHPRHRWYAEQLYDLILFQANTGLRPDEAQNLEFRDVKMVKDEATGELILEIDVRGKHGVGFCKSRAEAVKPFQRLLNRPKWTPQGRKPRSKKELAEWEARPVAPPELPKPNDRIFPGSWLKLFNRILDDIGLKLDRDGKPRTMYSLRHTYICMRLSEGADIYALSKNCRTSVEVIEKFYASHIKNLLDAAAINTRRPRRRPSPTEIRPE